MRTRCGAFGLSLLVAVAAAACGGGGGAAGGADGAEAPDGAGAPLRSLPGPGDAAAAGAVPALPFVPRAEDYSGDHPTLAGLPVSHDVVLLAFALGTSVAEANAVLAGIEGEVVGGSPGVDGVAEGILVVRLPTESHAALATALEGLRADPRVRVAVPDVLVSVDALPAAPAAPEAGWGWELAPSGGNWGLELIRAPQLWNFDPAVAAIGTSFGTAVVDAGFVDVHPDLSAQNLSPGVLHDHGTQVAGIIGATFDNGVGVVGVNPFAELLLLASQPVCPPGQPFLSCAFVSAGAQIVTDIHAIVVDHPEVRVINVSMGYNWAKAGIDPDTYADAQALAWDQGELARIALEQLAAGGATLPVIVVAAGNDGGANARYNSPFASAALQHGAANVIVVESLDPQPAHPGGATRRASSNVSGHVSAPGADILSTTVAGYGPISGTSAATPHVAGVVGYLYALAPDLAAPTLAANPALALIQGTALAVDGGAQNRLDAFAAALELDVVLGGDAVLRRLLDIDDGTEDGNLRHDGATGTATSGAAPSGDGVVDMADFRRWRDWLLDVEGAGAGLDGPPGHAFRDVNTDDQIGSPEEENVHPRGDFNGDGLLSRVATRYVGGVVAAEMTDLEVLQERFADPDVTAAELDGLLDSGDVTVRPAQCLGNADVVSVRSLLRDQQTEEVVTDRVHDGADRVVHTAPSGAYRARIEGRDADGQVVRAAELSVTVAPGADTFLDPACSLVVPDPLDCIGEYEGTFANDFGGGPLVYAQVVGDRGCVSGAFSGFFQIQPTGEITPIEQSLHDSMRPCKAGTAVITGTFDFATCTAQGVATAPNGGTATFDFVMTLVTP